MNELKVIYDQLGKGLDAIQEAEKLKADLQQLTVTYSQNNQRQSDTIKGQADTIAALQNEQKALQQEIEQLNNTIRLLKEQLEKPVPVPPVVPQKPKEKREPFRITKGGLYENLHIRSAKSEIACIEIATEEFVEITNCYFELAGYGIKNHSGKTNLLVHNCSFTALPHTGNTSSPRRCLSVNNVIALTVTNNTAEGCGFVTTNGNGQTGGKIRVLYNDVQNVNGLTLAGRVHANFVQIMNYRSVDAEVAYNRVVNAYGKSDVEDNVNIYNARGTAANPIRIHHNRIQGAFYHPSQEAKKYYSGGGIIADGDGDYNTAPAYLLIEENTLTGLGNYHIGLAAGNHNKVRNNIAVNAGILEDGRSFHDIASSPKMNTSGIWANPQSVTRGAMDNNVFENNTVGVNYYDRRNDISIMKGATATGTKHLPVVTKADEIKAILEWEHQHKDIKIGNL